MDRFEELANLSIRRGCGFALLAIVTAVTGMAGEPLLAVRSAAILTTLMGVILALKAYNAPTRSYRRTELWIMLDRRHSVDLPRERAQELIGGILREAYVRHAEIAGFAALALWMLTLTMTLVRRNIGA
jgi:hypothetical protein